MRCFIILLLIIITSCSDTQHREEKPPVPPPVPTVVIEDPTDIAAMRKQRDEAKATIKQLESKVINLDERIKLAEIEQVKWWSKLIGCIAIGLGTVCLVASFFVLQYPVIPTLLRYSSYILGSVGALAFLFAAAYAYFLFIGIGVAVIIVGTGIYLWNNDRRSLKQVVSVVDETKNEISNYKAKFRQKIDKRADAWIDRIRGVDK